MRRRSLRGAAGLALVVTLVLAVALPVATPAAAQQPAPRRPLVKIVATGGTIANSPTGRMSVDVLLAQMPQITEHARIEVLDLLRVPSSAIGVQEWIEISRAVEHIFATEPEVDGVVVTHGSNTSEETAYFLSLTVGSSKPIVITGAQRQQNTLGTEGTRNLFDAIRVAAHPAAAGKGALLVVNDMIHPARDVTKRISTRVETWDSGDAGALGVVDADQVTFYDQPVYKHTATSEVHLPPEVRQASQLPRVDIVYAYPGADGVMAEAAVRAGARAIVVAGYPTGNIPPAMVESLMRLRDGGTLVIMSHRGGLGRVPTNLPEPWVTADNLSPQKARVLAMLALARSPSPDFVRRVFASH